MKRGASEKGFTLIELSIVLVIIGLLAAGILVGRDMIRAAELRSVITDVQTFRTAVNTFSVKYNCLPGDCDHATIYWGRADGGSDTSQNCANPDTDTDTANPIATCNGSGDGVITGPTGEAIDWQNTEAYRFWQHLSDAQLIPGQYSGVGGAKHPQWRAATLGVNVPMMRYGTANGYLPVYGALINVSNWTGEHTTEPANRLWAGSQSNGDPPWGAHAFTPADAQSIDSKLDDGLPGSGNAIIYSTDADPTPCSTNNDTTTGRYNLTNKDYVCAMIFTMNR